jgi:hypothetical protein
MADAARKVRAEVAVEIHVPAKCREPGGWYPKGPGGRWVGKPNAALGPLTAFQATFASCVPVGRGKNQTARAGARRAAVSNGL